MTRWFNKAFNKTQVYNILGHPSPRYVIYKEMWSNKCVQSFCSSTETPLEKKSTPGQAAKAYPVSTVKIPGVQRGSNALMLALQRSDHCEELPLD